MFDFDKIFAEESAKVLDKIIEAVEKGKETIHKEDIINKVITRHPQLTRDDFTVERVREGE